MSKNIYEIIAKIADVDFDDVKDEAILSDDLGMDSLMIIDLSLEIEKIIGERVTPEDITQFNKVEDVVSYMKSH